MRKNFSRTIALGLADLENAAVDLAASQQAAAQRPRRSRVFHRRPRQPEDVIMSRRLSEWLCRHWQQAGKTPKRPEGD
jgi:hypothetical protein